MGVEMSKNYLQYANLLESQLKRLYRISDEAHKKGFDPELNTETEVAKDLAELVEGLVGPTGVAESIRELTEKLPREELALKIAEEIVYGKFGRMETHSAAEQAVRTSLAILTEGITAAPLQGVAKVSIKSNLDNTKYLAIYYAGPIRSAGGTDQALTLITGDFVRRLLGLDRYKPTHEEINRFIEEIRLYERNARSRGRFQYHVNDSQLRKALESIPVEVTGTESDPVEVQSFRNLPRIETNRVRGGALRVVNDGVIGRASKVWTIIEKLGIEGWDWLKHIGEADESQEEKEKTPSFMEDVIAGRPIFSFPSQPGGFRLRYGRARNTGLAAVGVHPLTMNVLDRFLAGGTQIRVELPGKGGVVMPVDTIEPPIVMLKDGTVTRVSNQSFPRIEHKIAKILFLGDLLVSFGDFLYNNRRLHPSGYTGEWWRMELEAAVAKGFSDLAEAAAAASISTHRLQTLLSNPFYNKPTAKEAVTLAKKLGVPLHPFHSFFWSNITTEEILEVRDWTLKAKIQREGEQISKITGDYKPTVKSTLEHLCLPHKPVENQIIIEGEYAIVLAACFGIGSCSPASAASAKVEGEVSPLEIIKRLSGFLVRVKMPASVGARMGRPEKAKRREMKPLVHVLFPVGLAGGPKRDLITASKKGPVHVDLIKRRCPKCHKVTANVMCSSCHVRTDHERLCSRCGRETVETVCPACKTDTQGFARQTLDLKAMVSSACRRLKVSQPETVKGAKGLLNENKVAEIVEKGILRAKEDLSVYKDGTVRFDATNAPLTHFKPAEIKVGVEKIRHLGYTVDSQGKPLTEEEQICELKIQDIVIPLKSATYFVRVARFLDELLEKVYNLPRYYSVAQVEDLVGFLVVGLAPHTSVGILGRIIGFSDLDVCYAHPLWHSAKRRDCDGDEDALMLALDTLLNFSKSYLPSKIGGIMDAPFFIIPIVNPMEVQRQAHEFDVAGEYPLSFYEETLEQRDSSKAAHLVDLVAQRLGDQRQFEGFGYTTPVSNINECNRKSMYKKLQKMTHKLNSQLELAEKIEAVDAKHVALKVLTTHFLRDISGNLRAYSTQRFRCKLCSKRFRRIPLRGECLECGGPLSLTVYRGGIEKYLNAATRLVKKYDLPSYYLNRLALVKEEINTLFEGDKPRQVSLASFA